MGIITAILSAIGTALVVVVNVIGGIVKAVPWWTWLPPLGMILGIYMVSGDAGCSCRDVGCGCRHPRPPATHTAVGKVVSVEAANHFTLRQRRRERAVTVAYVVDGGDAAGLAMTQHLLPVGSEVTVTVQGRRILMEESELADDAPEARCPLTGAVTGPSGADVGLELVKAGLATCSSDAPKEYQAAEKTAKRKGV